jgi:hemolysin III
MASENLPTPRTKLRGWFHTGYAPLVIASGIVLICLAPSGSGKLGAALFMACSTLLFTMSAIYNVFNWSASVKTVLRRIDHANIFLIIAGTYSPLALSVIPWHYSDYGFFSGEMLLIAIWILCAIGLILNVIWITAPRLVVTLVYIVLGLFAVVYLPTIYQSGQPFVVAIVALISSGGGLYIVGAVFYALKWPGKYAKVFGFHELFHICTILAFSCHSVAVYLALL